MNSSSQIRISKATGDHRVDVVALLQSEKLPVADLPASLDDFFIAVENADVVGAIGLELYSDCSLLRSMVVNNKYRNKKVASQLVQKLEEYAKTIGSNCMYLLTETAPQYFERKGYQRITRDKVPEQIKASSEFSHVCPVSAIVMKKSLTAYE